MHFVNNGKENGARAAGVVISVISFILCVSLYQHCNLVVLFVLLAIKGIRFQRKQARLSEHSLDEQIKILDTLGDLYCQVKAFHKALSCYKKEVF